MPIFLVVLSQNFIFCGAHFGSAIALDLQQKLKPFPHSSQQTRNGNAIFSWNL